MTSTNLEHQSEIQSFFKIQVANFKTKLQEIDQEFRAGGSEVEEMCLEKFTAAFHQSREECRILELTLRDEPRSLAEVQRRFRDELAPWFDQSWFFDRAKKKPRGYPGDFIMLTALYDEEVKSSGIGRIMDLYFLKADLARAVRTRLAAVKEFIIDEVQRRNTRVSILNVASGPGREYTRDFAQVADKISLFCIDSDEEALQHLKEHIDPEVAEKIDLQAICYNALKTKSVEKNLQNFGAVDIIYSVGLCDYIPDGIMIRILEGWRQSVAPEGVVYVAFKDSRTYHASEYQWHADWHFYQRTEEDCLRLFAEAGYDMDQLQVFRDETGIIMNFLSRQPVAQGTRQHGEHAIPAPHFPVDGARTRTEQDAVSQDE